MSRSNPHTVSVPYPNCHDEGKAAGRDYMNGINGISGINPEDLKGKRNPLKPCPGSPGTQYFYPHDEGKVYDRVKADKEEKSDKKEEKKEEKKDTKKEEKTKQKTESLVQKTSTSIPACNSHTFPGCKDAKNAKTVAGDWAGEYLRPVLNEKADIRYPNQSSGYV